MAVRRGFQNTDVPFGEGADDDPFAGRGGLDNLFGMSGAPPMQDAGPDGGELPDDALATSPAAQRGGDLAGNMERAREFMPHERPPSYTGGLPEGVTVPDTQFQGVPPSSNAMQTSLSPLAPSPVAMQQQPASFAPAESGGTGVGPQRRGFTPAQSALFGESPGKSGLFGGPGGLTEGGYGVFGTNEGGPSPTEMMLALARMLKQGGDVAM